MRLKTLKVGVFFKKKRSCSHSTLQRVVTVTQRPHIYATSSRAVNHYKTQSREVSKGLTISNSDLISNFTRRQHALNKAEHQEVRTSFYSVAAKQMQLSRCLNYLYKTTVIVQTAPGLTNIIN